jgi:steroid delta-isomerase-like uncharacterized protein
MSEQNKALAKRWFEEVWNQGRESSIDELFHPQGKTYGFPEPDSVLIGPDGFKTVHRVFHNAFGNIHIAIDDLIAEEDKVAIRWTCTMVQNGEGLGFPATGKNVAFPGSSFIHCREGQIIHGWNFMDLTKMTQQLQRS